MNASIRGVAAPDAAVFAWAASVIPARRVLGIEPAGLLRVQ
jgi:ABC-type lipoprotein release transport system permease subunit